MERSHAVRKIPNPDVTANSFFDSKISFTHKNLKRRCLTQYTEVGEPQFRPPPSELVRAWVVTVQIASDQICTDGSGPLRIAGPTVSSPQPQDRLAATTSTTSSLKPGSERSAIRFTMLETLLQDASILQLTEALASKSDQVFVLMRSRHPKHIQLRSSPAGTVTRSPEEPKSSQGWRSIIRITRCWKTRMTPVLTSPIVSKQTNIGT